jgi:post-segregation antitoxin (ccd killing protein)
MLENSDREQWLKKNQDAMKEANDYIVSKGLWSEGLRQF